MCLFRSFNQEVVLLAKGVPGDLIDTHFQYMEVWDVDIIEARTQDNKPYQILCIKESYYVMNIMENWMTLDELEGEKQEETP